MFNVGQLKEALKNIPDNLSVYVKAQVINESDYLAAVYCENMENYGIDDHCLVISATAPFDHKEGKYSYGLLKRG